MQVKIRLRTLILATSLLLCATPTIFAQIHIGDISLLKGKTKVFIGGYQRKEIEDIVRKDSSLMIVPKKEEADFCIYLSVGDVSGSKLSLNGAGQIGPDNVYDHLNSTISPADTPYTVTRIVRLSVGIEEGNTKYTQVWLREWTDVLTSQPVSAGFNDPAYRQRIGPPPQASPRAIETLVNGFLRDLRKKT